MYRSLIITIALAASVLAACSEDDADSTVGATTVVDTVVVPTSTVSPTVETVETVETVDPVGTSTVETEPTETEPTGPDTTAVGVVPSLTIDAAPATASDAAIAVDFDSITDDHIIRRGSQGLIEQGQTFSTAADTTLTAVAFAVVPAELIPAGTPLELTLLEVGDPDLAVPSAGVEIDGTIGLVLDTPAAMLAGVVTDLTFAFPEVRLVGGTTYAVTLGFGDGAPAAEMFLQHADEDVLPSGVAIWLEGANWKSDSTTDQAIRLVLR